MALGHWRVPSLLAIAVLLLIACAGFLAHAAPSSHAGCGLQSAETSNSLGGLLDLAAVPTAVSDAQVPATRCARAFEATLTSPYRSPAARPPSPRGPPALSLLSA